VTTTNITAVRPSTLWLSWNVNPAFPVPSWNQVTALAYGPPPETKCHATMSDSTNAAPTAMIPTSAPLPRIRFPKNAITPAATSGKTGISQLYLITS